MIRRKHQKQTNNTAQKNKISKDFFSKYDQIQSFLWVWSHLLNKSLIVNLIFAPFDFDILDFSATNKCTLEK